MSDVGLGFFVAVVVASLLNGLIFARSQRQRHELRRVVDRMDRLMTAWAESWGEPDDVVKGRLRAALRRDER